MAPLWLGRGPSLLVQRDLLPLTVRPCSPECTKPLLVAKAMHPVRCVRVPVSTCETSGHLSVGLTASTVQMHGLVCLHGDCAP